MIWKTLSDTAMKKYQWRKYVIRIQEELLLMLGSIKNHKKKEKIEKLEKSWIQC